jgi:apolipoprotein N-acyltransferase
MGKIEKYIPLNTRGYLDVKINKNKILRKTLYTLIGKNISSYLLLLILLIVLLQCFISEKLKNEKI